MTGQRRGPSAVQLSILDRLLDSAPDGPRDASPSALAVRERLLSAVQRDMEQLLNARRPWQSTPSSLRELRLSPLGFGMPDFTVGSFNDRHQREVVRAEVEDTVRRFEPRLQQVQVRLIGDTSLLRGTLQLRIDAVLRVEPVFEPIAFDTTIDAATASTTLRQVYGS